MSKGVPDVVEKICPTPNGGDRAIGAFLDENRQPTSKDNAKYFLVKELKQGKGICKILYEITSTGTLKMLNKTML
ncbi:MAG: hypothetical protein LBN07_05120 [Christensenellaceae bacterium]|nr:hypothetical protein [Christensenellaceae bacterium]